MHDGYWEYAHVYIKSGDTRGDFTEILNDWGLEGWELVTCELDWEWIVDVDRTMDHSYGVAYPRDIAGWHCVFKRPARSGSKQSHAERRREVRRHASEVRRRISDQEPIVQSLRDVADRLTATTRDSLILSLDFGSDMEGLTLRTFRTGRAITSGLSAESDITIRCNPSVWLSAVGTTGGLKQALEEGTLSFSGSSEVFDILEETVT